MQFCKFAPSKVNLMAYNPIDDGEFQQADEEATDILEQNNSTDTIRHSRGKYIDAAYGQLANKT